ncbi:MAG: Arm DNA-binding domain-containing protein [Nitrosomonadaceae bacterium]|nr:Arm DNA-binding domain-containing protein [Nitrosomonadaceae bacterium]
MSGGIGGKLTDKAVKAFVAKAQRGKKLPDGGGLHLFITPAGGTTWRIKYRIDGTS